MPATRLPFDERASTVNVALALWIGVMAGVIVGLGGFEEVDPWKNAYVRLATLGATSTLLVMAFSARSVRSERRYQLGVLLSLLAHTGLGVGLAMANLAMLQPLAVVDAPPVEEPEQVDLSDLVVIDRTEVAEKADFERPLESGAAQREAEAPEPERDAPKTLDTMIQPTEAPAYEPPAPEAPRLNRPTPSIAQADIAPGERRRNPTPAASIAASAAEYQSDLVPLTPPASEPQPRAAAMDAQRSPAPILVTPVAPTQTPVARPAAPTVVQPRRDAAAVAALPSVEPSTRPAARPRVLAELGPTPLEPINATPNQSTAELAGPPMTDLAPARIPSLSRSQPALPTPTAAPDAPPGSNTPDAVARPQRLAMRDLSPSPRVLSRNESRGSRAAPLASLGAGSAAVAAPAELLGSREGVPGRAADLAAPTGDGGLGSKPAPAAGLDRLAASREATANLTPGRFRNTPSGGSPSVSGDAKQPAAAFSSRGKRREQLESGSQGAPSPRTEAAIELGLKFLDGIQRDDGSWAFTDLGDAELNPAEIAQAQADGAATGLALLAFLGAGYDHTEGRYQETIRRGVDYLLAKQSSDGLLFPESSQDSPWQVARFYSHGIATIALCEAYGMTGDPRLRRPAQQALDYIARTQVNGRGGWRYTPGVNSDLSVTGWMLMALRSGDLAGLRVREVTYEGVRGFLESCRERDGSRSRFCYNPAAPADDPRTSHGRNPGTVMTSVGLLMQLYLGEGRESARMQSGADHLLANLPTVGDSRQPAATSTLGNPMRDTYYWYYGTQVMFHMGGNHWNAWNDSLHPLLVESQTTTGELAGSWNPVHPVPDKWRHMGGRLYVTALNLLSLEVYYRHLPLYEMTGE